MLLAIARLPEAPDLAAQVASALGLARADAAHRLAGTLPRILLLDAREEPLRAHAATLEALGLTTIVCDPARAASDRDRVVARTLELGPDGVVAIDRAGARHEVPAASIALFQRGARVSTSQETVHTTERKLDLGRAVLTGGLVPTRKVEKTSVSTSTSREAFVLIERRGGAPGVILYERRLDYRFLGQALQPASAANLARTLALLGAIAPHAPVDDRASRPGFVPAVFSGSSDPLDLGLYLVRLAHERG
jgi:hypothetical protein